MFHMQERQISLPLLFKKTVHNVIRRFLFFFFFLNLDENLIIFSGLMLIYY